MLIEAFETEDEAHRKLEQVRGQKRVIMAHPKHGNYEGIQENPDEAEHPLAECRVDPNADKPYQVWSCPEDVVARISAADQARNEAAAFAPEDIAKLKKLLEMLDK